MEFGLFDIDNWTRSMFLTLLLKGKRLMIYAARLGITDIEIRNWGYRYWFLAVVSISQFVFSSCSYLEVKVILSSIVKLLFSYTLTIISCVDVQLALVIIYVLQLSFTSFSLFCQALWVYDIIAILCSCLPRYCNSVKCLLRNLRRDVDWASWYILLKVTQIPWKLQKVLKQRMHISQLFLLSVFKFWSFWKSSVH